MGYTVPLPLGDPPSLLQLSARYCIDHLSSTLGSKDGAGLKEGITLPQEVCQTLFEVADKESEGFEGVVVPIFQVRTRNFPIYQLARFMKSRLYTRSKSKEAIMNYKTQNMANDEFYYLLLFILYVVCDVVCSTLYHIINITLNITFIRALCTLYIILAYSTDTDNDTLNSH